jgi:hypothetical protein
MENATLRLDYGDLEWLRDRMTDTRSCSVSESGQEYAGRILKAIEAAQDAGEHGRVEVEVSGGTVQSVRFCGPVQSGLLVAVYDYDIDGTDNAEAIERGHFLDEHFAP